MFRQNTMDFNALFRIFTENLLPILLISGAGFLLGKFLSVDTRSVGRVVFYVFSPILVFDLIVHTQLSSGQIFATMGYTASVAASVGCLAFLFGKALQLERPVLSAVVMTAAFANTGNYGLPLVSFAFGRDALAFATLYYATTSALFNTFGVLIASLGHMDFKAAVLGLFRVPTVYAVVLAALLNRFHIVMSVPLARTVDLAANGAIPVMIILLGLELSRVEWSHSIHAVGLSTGLRLLVGPMIGLLLLIPFGFHNPARQGVVTEASMPAAVANTVVAAEYGLDSSLVTAIVFVGTILSPLTLTPLIYFLGR